MEAFAKTVNRILIQSQMQTLSKRSPIYLGSDKLTYKNDLFSSNFFSSFSFPSIPNQPRLSNCQTRFLFSDATHRD